MKTVVVICAHASASRMPASALTPLIGRPVLARLVERVRAARLVREVVVATSIDPKDDAIAHLCTSAGIAFFRSDATTAADAQLRIARLWCADAVVTVAPSQVLIDPAIIDRVAEAFLEASDRYDHVSNLVPATYPAGQAVELVPLRVLEATREPATARHPLGTPSRLDVGALSPARVRNVRWERAAEPRRAHRLAFTQPLDYEFVRAIFHELWTPARPVFALDEILALLDARPDIAELDASAQRPARHEYRVRAVRGDAPGLSRVA